MAVAKDSPSQLSGVGLPIVPLGVVLRDCVSNRLTDLDREIPENLSEVFAAGVDGRGSRQHSPVADVIRGGSVAPIPIDRLLPTDISRGVAVGVNFEAVDGDCGA